MGCYRRAIRSDPVTPPSESTLPLEECNEDIFPWADYADVSSMPSSSRNAGKAPINYEEESDFEGSFEESSEEASQEASGSGNDDEGSEADEEEDNEWSPWVPLASLFSLFGVSMPKGEK